MVSTVRDGAAQQQSAVRDGGSTTNNEQNACGAFLMSIRLIAATTARFPDDNNPHLYCLPGAAKDPGKSDFCNLVVVWRMHLCCANPKYKKNTDPRWSEPGSIPRAHIGPKRMNHYSRAGSRLSTTGGGGACVGASYAINVRLPPFSPRGPPFLIPPFPCSKV